MSISNNFPSQWNSHYTSDDTWDEIEEAIFLLGLHRFGKDFNKVKKIVGNKTMGDIQAYYYGKFYKSDRYKKWHTREKIKSKSGKNMSNILTRPQQLELLSHLLPNISEECCSNLLKVIEKFTRGKMPLKDYVSTLKAIGRCNALAEAVGNGTEKDHTGLTAYFGKSTEALPLPPEIPNGKHYARLTHEEVILILTDGLRLSKAQSNYLFWEAVWPRLLARGWHSEQLRGNSDAVGSKKPLLFYVPGVNHFSSTLIKGTHYFDSVADILAKVASDPVLINFQSVQSVASDYTSLLVPPEAKRRRTYYAKRNFNGADSWRKHLFSRTNNDQGTTPGKIKEGARQEEGSSCAGNSDHIGSVVAKKYVCPRVNQTKVSYSHLNHSKHQHDMVTLRRSKRTTQPTKRILESLAMDHPETNDK